MELLRRCAGHTAMNIVKGCPTSDAILGTFKIACAHDPYGTRASICRLNVVKRCINLLLAAHVLQVISVEDHLLNFLFRSEGREEVEAVLVLYLWIIKSILLGIILHIFLQHQEREHLMEHRQRRVASHAALTRMS
jgi:hypothetical protein